LKTEVVESYSQRFALNEKDTVIYQLIYKLRMAKTKTIEHPMFKHPIDRYPRLDTVLMIEEALRKSKGDYSLRQLWQKLPKKVMWQTYLTVIDYLEHSGKIMIDSRDNHPIWTAMSDKMRERYEKGLLVDATPYISTRAGARNARD
jgi:hypothetical protein